jgi:hypothetical protein
VGSVRSSSLRHDLVTRPHQLSPPFGSNHLERVGGDVQWGCEGASRGSADLPHPPHQQAAEHEAVSGARRALVIASSTIAGTRTPGSRGGAISEA